MSRFSESSFSDYDATLDSTALPGQDAADSAYGPLRTISFMEVVLQSEAGERAKLAAEISVVTVEAPVATETSVAKETRKLSMAAVSSGAKHTFGAAKWTVSTTFTWIFRAVFWIVPTTIGFMMNTIAAILVLMIIQPSGFWGYLLAVVLLMFAGMIPGAILAAGQSRALKSVGLGGFIWWMLTLTGNVMALPIAACIGWHIGRQVGDNTGIAVGTLAGLLLFGGIIGAWQAYILKYFHVTLWWLWVLPSSVGAVIFAVAVLLTTATQKVDLVGSAMTGGLIYGAFTGVSLVLLIRQAVKLNRMLGELG